MHHIPPEIGPIHFIGIGGIGMSGIAEALAVLGYKVQGSDAAENYNTVRLKSHGVRVFHGHDAQNLITLEGKYPGAVVVSSAIPAGNPELIAARAQRIPIVSRAEMLAELMRLKWAVAIAGTHGKTTTTSLVGAVLEAAKLDPTVINGGIVNSYGTNTRLGQGEWMVVEADESDGSFTRLPATIAIVTNIDPEHMDHYGSFQEVRAAYLRYVEQIPFYGCGVLCLDHPVVQSLIPEIQNRTLITYGFNKQSDVRAENIRASSLGSHFDVVIARQNDEQDPQIIRNLFLPMMGAHNIQNACAAIAVAVRLNIDESCIRTALGNFSGVKRRFTRTGMTNGILVVDDYGHHPVEIAAVLKAGRQALSGPNLSGPDESATSSPFISPFASPFPPPVLSNIPLAGASNGGKIIAVVQPHRYTRLRDLFEEFCTCFDDADCVIVADVYAAGEEAIAGIDQQSLVAGIKSHGHKHVEMLDHPDHLADMISKLAQAGDIVICLGAGNITYWAQALPQQLEDMGEQKLSA